MSVACLRYLIAITVGAAGCAVLFANVPHSPDLELIDRLNALVQLRFMDPAPASLGMSRVARPPSFGAHFRPVPTAATDFRPENGAERDVIAELEARQLQAGLYLFGEAIGESEASDLNFRALKGPAVMTRGTPRPEWYPGSTMPVRTNPDALPDWREIYPLARKAMQSFKDGGAPFETVFGAWEIAARPIVASEERCAACHNNSAYRPARAVKLNDVIGGVLYAYRRAGG